MKLTHKIVVEHANYANLYLKNYEIKLNRRNGYSAIDIYYKEGGLYDTIFVGTSKEVYNYISGMIEGARFKDMLKPF